MPSVSSGLKALLRAALLTLVIAIAGYWGVTSAQAHDAPSGSIATDTNVRTIDGSCEAQGLISIPGLALCTHGDDPSTSGTSSPSPVMASSANSTGVCIGDGVSGKRIQVIYARASDVTSRLDSYKASFQVWANDASSIFAESARKTGGTRYLRYVQDANCSIQVTPVTLTRTGDDSFGALVSELNAQGYNRSDRKYLVFLDRGFAGVCGQGTLWLDDSPGASNYNNTQTGYAAIYNGCWGAPAAIAHELSHTLGAVQDSAPHSSGSGHCTDEWDIMCYSDRSGNTTSIACGDTNGELRLDCNNDDYFHTSPAAGSYLATHWNVARSEWLGGSSLAISLSPESSKYNGHVQATLAGFSPGKRIYLSWDGAKLTSVIADTTGSASITFLTPLATFGDHIVSARDGNGLRVQTAIRIIPRISLSAPSGPNNTTIRVYFYGFAAGERVDVIWSSNNSVLKTVTIAENGRGTVLVRIPKGAKIGLYSIRGRVQGVNRSASTSFSVTGLTSSDDPTATPTATATPTGTVEPTGTPVATETPVVDPSPTEIPTDIPTETEVPTEEPTAETTPEPTVEPTLEPTLEPTSESTPEPTPAPTDLPADVEQVAISTERRTVKLA